MVRLESAQILQSGPDRGPNIQRSPPRFDTRFETFAKANVDTVGNPR